MAGLQLNGFEKYGIPFASDRMPIVVGLYGVPGSGKTYLLNQLKQNLDQTQFAFYEGSTMIDTAVPGGLKAFENMDEQEKEHWRKHAIDTISKECASSGHVGIVVGHFMFWSEEQQVGSPVYTQNDLRVFTHILYLDTPADVVEQRCRDDTERKRSPISASHLCKWQQEEKTQLRDICRHRQILFLLMSYYPTENILLDKVSTLLLDFKSHSVRDNLTQAESRLDHVFAASGPQLKTVLVLDADRTLAAEDTGNMFWEKVSNNKALEYKASTLKALFTGPLKYSHIAFRQASLLYEEVADHQDFGTLCQEVASAVTMHPDFVSLLHLVAEEECVGAVVITSGLRRVWEKVLEREGLSKKVEVIGGGCIADGFVVSAEVKGALVARLRQMYDKHVWSFGDSPLDLIMLGKADQAIIVVGEEQTRSKLMDKTLPKEIRYHGLRARQAILPSNVSPRLDTNELPIIKLTEPDFVKSLLGSQDLRGGLQVLCATDKNTAKLLATPTRDAPIAGPRLRKAHRRIGHYLAIEFLVDVIGIEKCPIQHVLGHQTKGFQLFHEQQTTIVALMRGGEPMALGVSDAFPLAMFVHAGEPEDLKPHHLEGQITVILVDSVINTGKTIIEFVQRVRELHATIRIVVVAGVVQAECVSEDGLKMALANCGTVHLVALRLSDTKFTGSGTTDTGNRLFNTTHLP